MLKAVARRNRIACRFTEPPAAENTKRRLAKKLNTIPMDAEKTFARTSGTPARRKPLNIAKSREVFMIPTIPNRPARFSSPGGVASVVGGIVTRQKAPGGRENH